MIQVAFVQQTLRSKLGRVAMFLVVVGLLSMGAALLSAPQWVSADAPLAIKQMKVSLWPEYDDPRLLVILEGEYDASATFPQKVRFRLPKGVEINQVCALKKPANEHLCQLYETQADGDSLIISYTLPIPTFFLEFYWDIIQAGADAKTIAYDFQSLDTIDNLEVEVQQPLKASDLKMEPSTSEVRSDTSGFKYYHAALKNVAAEQKVAIKASYVKPDSKPSIAKKTGGNASSSSSKTNLSLIFGIGGVLVVGLGVFGIVKSRSRRLAPAGAQARARVTQAVVSAPARRAPAPAPVARPRANGGQARSGGFCSNCGMELVPDDNFCPNCGKGRKRPE